jgi:ketosteroid isomerase-like protein
MNDQQSIEQLKENLVIALRNKDVAAAIVPFADKTVMFLLAPPLRFTTGQNAPGANGIQEWFSSFDGPIGLAYQELEITIGGDVAFCHSLEHLTGKRVNGTTTDVWFRESLGCV